MKKVELLAPAGNYESFLGAVHAGADAVYLGGEKFGARAYADNFTTQEVCDAIKYAHIYGRRVYLTLNTLVKEREFPEVYGYLLPFYETGLDGVIIQDLGVFRMVGEWFPELARHISTQMTITGRPGAAYLKAAGAVRIVPARELSLAEIRKIKEKVDIEIEAFVHGAICYCYSGQCLFSSLLGGRSGNRGRCAQPCRLPYQTGKAGEKKYPLSLKDMCTIEILDQLIEAGIDSFKIEGRMKSAEYAAGVTAIYRKYIDRYYSNPSGYRVEPQDMEKLQSLYIRSGIGQGYYHQHNGRNMIALENPGYMGRDDKLAEQIRAQYLADRFRLPVSGEAVLAAGKEAALTLERNGIRIQCLGDVVQEAHMQPLTEESVRKQLGKCGNTPFFMEHLRVDLSGDTFLPVKALNALRRETLEKLERELLKQNGFPVPGERTARGREAEDGFGGSASYDGNGKAKKNTGEQGIIPAVGYRLHAYALKKDQCRAAAECGIERIYVEADLCVDRAWLEELSGQYPKVRWYMALPSVIRMRDRLFWEQAGELLQTPIFSGVLVRNLESLQLLQEYFNKWPAEKEIVSGQELYIWNHHSRDALCQDCGESYVPYELNMYELKELTEAAGKDGLAASVYGRIPLMVTANCIARTANRCRQGKPDGEWSSLIDRYGKTFPVYINCFHCYNVIYNSLPLSLHQNLDRLKGMGISTFRLDFTTESGKETENIIRFWQVWAAGGKESCPYTEYTNGHWKRGAE